jgi:hypothetical protein
LEESESLSSSARPFSNPRELAGKIRRKCWLVPHFLSARTFLVGGLNRERNRLHWGRREPSLQETETDKHPEGVPSQCAVANAASDPEGPSEGVRSPKGTDRIDALGSETKSSDGSVPMREIGRVRHSNREHGTQCRVYPAGASLPRHPTGGRIGGRHFSKSLSVRPI